MSYIAKQYVTVANKVRKPGERIKDAIKPEALARFLKSGAIEPDPAPVSELPVTGDNAGDGVPDGNGQDSAELTRQNHADQLENLGYDASGDRVDQAEAEEVTEEAVEEEAPEIDAMDGIAAPAQQAEDAEPVKKNGRRKKA